jgi:nucleoside 2-deoxyribosyltransferase
VSRVIYVAGPFRGPNSWEIEQNIRRAEELALEVWRMPGLSALCPHMNTRHYQGVLPDEVWLEGDLEQMSRCDAVLVVPNWIKSQGTTAEIRHAESRGIPVFYSLGDLHAWAFPNTK